MTENKRRLQVFAAVALLLLMAGTFLSFFIAPVIEDARVRDALGDPNATVTDTARSPWIYTGEDENIMLYPDKVPFRETLVIPTITNGNYNRRFAIVPCIPMRIKTLVMPQYLNLALDTKNGLCHGWLTLERMVFPEGTTNILHHIRIGNTPALKEIYFPASITRAPWVSVRDDVAEQLTIHYAGTEEAWLALGENAKTLAETYTMRYESVYEK